MAPICATRPRTAAHESTAQQAAGRASEFVSPRPILREAPHAGPEPSQQRSGEGRAVAQQVRTEFGKSGPRSSAVGSFGVSPSKDAVVANQSVGPSGSPTRGASGNNCTPGVEVLNWTVVRDGANWRADVTSMVVSGTVNVRPWPSLPSSMTTPNTANPVDGGNINNRAGSPNHWKAAIDDMADYDTVGAGGAGANWHATAASSAHEWYHWNTDHLVSSIGAGNWTTANRAIDALTVPAAAHADAAAARAALAPEVTARFNAFVGAVTRHWNTVITPADVPGGGGGAYATGMGVLNGLIGQVRAYAASKGWDRPAAPAAPAPGGAGGAAGGGPGTGP